MTLKLHMVEKVDFFSNLFKFKRNTQTSRKIFFPLRASFENYVPRPILVSDL
jgi:hypothetical protein